MARKKKGDDEMEAGGNVLSAVPSYLDRIERLNEEKKAIGEDITDVYREMKGAGLNPKVMKLLVTKRKKDRTQQEELEGLLAQYEAALEPA